MYFLWLISMIAAAMCQGEFPAWYQFDQNFPFFLKGCKLPINLTVFFYKDIYVAQDMVR